MKKQKKAGCPDCGYEPHKKDCVFWVEKQPKEDKEKK